ncbi:MAG TPA: DUF6702 family protein [Pyrinomonadaceae bacterium]|nr:DUF6702 family protein [Pyrinomonadaceae bacterium]
MTITWLVSCGLAGLPPARAAHKFYTSIARAEYNAETKSLEVSARVFADDLELALTKKNNRDVRLDATKDIGALVLAYLQDSFELKEGDGGEAKQLTWVGMETNVDVVWLYFEIKLGAAPRDARMRNRLFFELFPEQVNVVQFVNGERKSELVFKQGSNFQVVASGE